MRLALAAIWLLLATTARAAEPPLVPPAQEGVRLLQALETTPLAVIGRVGECAAIDLHGWRAALVVESALVGEAKAGETLTIAWEELSGARPERFVTGERLLLALEPLASGSLWRARFPDVVEYVRVRAVSQRGLAFLRSPSLGSVQLLAHYLALPAGGRASPAGRAHLLALAAEGERALAVSAAARLATLGAGAPLEAGEATLALQALTRAEGDGELSGELLTWIARTRPPGLAERLDAALAADPRAPANFVSARAALPGGIANEHLATLLGDPAPARRAAAAGAATAAESPRLAALARRDPAPEVRIAALRRLAALDGARSLEALLEAFPDREPAVRAEAARLAAGLGPGAVPRLREVALGWPSPAPETAVSALRLSNSPEAVEALRVLADTHADARIRALAALAVGRPLGHAD